MLKPEDFGSKVEVYLEERYLPQISDWHKNRMGSGRRKKIAKLPWNEIWGGIDPCSAQTKL